MILNRKIIGINQTPLNLEQQATRKKRRVVHKPDECVLPKRRQTSNSSIASSGAPRIPTDNSVHLDILPVINEDHYYARWEISKEREHLINEVSATEDTDVIRASVKRYTDLRKTSLNINSFTDAALETFLAFERCESAIIQDKLGKEKCSAACKGLVLKEFENYLESYLPTSTLPTIPHQLEDLKKKLYSSLRLTSEADVLKTQKICEMYLIRTLDFGFSAQKTKIQRELFQKLIHDYSALKHNLPKGAERNKINRNINLSKRNERYLKVGVLFSFQVSEAVRVQVSGVKGNELLKEGIGKVLIQFKKMLSSIRDKETDNTIDSNSNTGSQLQKEPSIFMPSVSPSDMPNDMPPLPAGYQWERTCQHVFYPTQRPIMTQQWPIMPQQRPIVPQQWPMMSQQRPIVPQHWPMMSQQRPIVPQHWPMMSQQQPIVPPHPMMLQQSIVDPGQAKHPHFHTGPESQPSYPLQTNSTHMADQGLLYPHHTTIEESTAAPAAPQKPSPKKRTSPQAAPARVKSYKKATQPIQTSQKRPTKKPIVSVHPLEKPFSTLYIFNEDAATRLWDYFTSLGTLTSKDYTDTIKFLCTQMKQIGHSTEPQDFPHKIREVLEQTKPVILQVIQEDPETACLVESASKALSDVIQEKSMEELTLSDLEKALLQSRIESPEFASTLRYYCEQKLQVDLSKPSVRTSDTLVEQVYIEVSILLNRMLYSLGYSIEPKDFPHKVRAVMEKLKSLCPLQNQDENVTLHSHPKTSAVKTSIQKPTYDLAHMQQLSPSELTTKLIRTVLNELVLNCQEKPDFKQKFKACLMYYCQYNLPTLPPDFYTSHHKRIVSYNKLESIDTSAITDKEKKKISIQKNSERRMLRLLRNPISFLLFQIHKNLRTFLTTLSEEYIVKGKQDEFTALLEEGFYLLNTRMNELKQISQFSYEKTHIYYDPLGHIKFRKSTTSEEDTPVPTETNTTQASVNEPSASIESGRVTPNTAQAAETLLGFTR